MLTVTEAQHQIRQFAHSFGSESIGIDKVLNRVLAQDIAAKRDSPPFNRAAMDGISIKFSDVEAEIKKYVIIETIHAGDSASKIIVSGQCYKIMTGAAVPDCSNCVIRIEDCIQSENVITISNLEVKYFQNIAAQAEDFAANSVILKAGQICSPTIISVLASLGLQRIEVKKLPSIGLIATGNEIVPIYEEPNKVQIRDSNSYAMAAFLENYKINIGFSDIVSDNPEHLKKIIGYSLKHDITIITGGVSAGDADHVPEVLQTLGVKKIFHKVQVKPGKPIWIGVFEDNKVVFALPGNPISVQVAYKIFIEPYLRACFGLPNIPPILLPMAAQRTKKVKFDEYFPCRLTNTPFFGIEHTKFNGSGDIVGTINTIGLALHPSDQDILHLHDVCEVIFW